MSKRLELDQTPSYSASDQDLSCLQRLLQLRFFTVQSSKGYEVEGELVMAYANSLILTRY